MRKAFTLILASFIALTSVQTFAAPEAVKVKVKISGAPSDNRYFLCMRGVGCLSILAAQKGKVFPVFRTTDMSQLFIRDISNMSLTPQGLPASCRGTVEPNQSLTISGSIVNQGGKVKVSGLRCTIG